MQIIKGDLRNPAVVALLSEHLQGMAECSPPQSDHTLDIAALEAPDITFWSAWDDAILLGCGALKELDADSGEIKSMRTADGHLGKGVASRILQHIIDIAKKRDYSRLCLETGSSPPFQPAHSLYEKFGFIYCGPFGEYRDDPHSRFMTFELSASD